MANSAFEELFPGWLPLLQLARTMPAGGAVSVKSFATPEVQVRLHGNLASLLKRDRYRRWMAARSRRRDSLVLWRKTQTDPETGELVTLPRRRSFKSGARHYIREAASVMHLLFGKNVHFITLTLPGSTREAIESLAQYDKDIKNAFLQNIRKLHAKTCNVTKEPLHYVCISELQRRGAIHFHLAVGWSNKRFARLLQRCCRSWWIKLLGVYSDKTGVDWFLNPEKGSWRGNSRVVRVQCKKVRKSVRGYMAKYLSKARSKGEGEDFDDPSRWWSVSIATRKVVLKHRQSHDFSFRTWDDARQAVEKAAFVLKKEGYDVRPMYNPGTKEPIGVVVMVCDDLKGLVFEWFVQLLIRIDSIQIPDYEPIFDLPARWGYWEETECA